MGIQTGFIYDPVFLDHRPTQHHPENPNRLQAILNGLDASNLRPSLPTWPIPQLATDWLSKTHTPEHIRRMMDTKNRSCDFLDADTYVNNRSYDVALRAVDGVLSAVDAVMEGSVSNVFCAVRPPGHHAESDRAMGFCLFNNVAVGTKYGLERHGLRKIAIIDWDVHHGNGTQEIFYADASVLYFSIHQSPLYPGTGSAAETGVGPGLGLTLNVPMPAGADDNDYVRVFEQSLADAVQDFKPELIMISAGFDAHTKDPLASMKLTSEGFGRLTKLVMQMADAFANGRIVSVLEGGYHPEALSDSVVSHVSALLGK